VFLRFVQGWGLNAGGSDDIPHLKKRIHDFFQGLNHKQGLNELNPSTNEDKTPQTESLDNIPTSEELTFPGEGNKYRYTRILN
jgi:hypothetical protein